MRRTVKQEFMLLWSPLIGISTILTMLLAKLKYIRIDEIKQSYATQSSDINFICNKL